MELFFFDVVIKTSLIWLLQIVIKTNIYAGSSWLIPQVVKKVKYGRMNALYMKYPQVAIWERVKKSQQTLLRIYFLHFLDSKSGFIFTSAGPKQDKNK